MSAENPEQANLEPTNLEPGTRNLEPENYCRQIEAYLCRKNDGHLVRIVGPGFEQVCGWAARGVPFAVACRGIDRYFERYYAKGPRRRPVQIQFCDADVLDVFDEWRRAVGVTASAPVAGAEAGGADFAHRRQASLPTHLERVVARLTGLRGGESRSLDAEIELLVRELDTARAGAKSLRGPAREVFVERLRALDAQLMEAALARCDEETLHALRAEADAELGPFRDRLPTESYNHSRRACMVRLLRERRGLPVVAYD